MEFLDRTESLPIYIMFGTTGCAFLAYYFLPPYIGSYYAVVTAAIFYFGAAPILLLMNLFAERDAGRMKIIVATVFGPWNDQDIIQFKYKNHHTEAIPGSDDNITTLDLVEPHIHPRYRKVWQVKLIHRGRFIGDNLKLGHGQVIHWAVMVEHSATDKLVLYESSFVREDRATRIPVYKVKHSPVMYEFETGKMDRVERDRELQELEVPGAFA